LPHHRDTVNEAIRRVGWYPLAMEHCSAESGYNPLSFSFQMVDRADLFIGIIAFRYGDVPKDPIANSNGWSTADPGDGAAAAEGRGGPHRDSSRVVNPCVESVRILFVRVPEPRVQRFHHAMIAFTTLPATSVRRKSRPE
jgi:hypothetical protein